MGLRPRRTEERFEEWFQDRLDRWVEERFSAEFDARLRAGGDSQFQDRFEALFDERADAWADGQFQDRFEALFASAFSSRIRTWKETDLKKGFDRWAEHWFDLLFQVWANTWADGSDFQERFVRNFDTRFEERLDSEVKARVANEVNTLIDKRIEQWLLAVRQDLIDAAPPASAEHSHDAAQHNAPDNGSPASEGVATAAELAAYLAKGPLQPQRIRQLLRGMEIPGRRPHAYPLGEAASALLLRKGRMATTAEHDATEESGDTPEP